MTTTTPQREGAKPSLPPLTGRDHSAEVAQDKRQLRMAMYLEQGGRCWYCDCVMRIYPPMKNGGKLPSDYPTFEHITPVRRLPGTGKMRPDTPDYLKATSNQVLVCEDCNSTRSARPLTDFIGELRQAGKVRGIVSRIKRLVNDRFPEPTQAEAFAAWMNATVAGAVSPADALQHLPVELLTLLPDPSRPLPRRPQPALKTLLQRVRRRIRHLLTTLLEFFPVGR